MEDIIDKRINNLIALRQLITQVLTVLISGVVGVLFIPDSPLKAGLFILGVYFIIILSKNLINTMSELNGYLYKRNKEKNNG